MEIKPSPIPEIEIGQRILDSLPEDSGPFNVPQRDAQQTPRAINQPDQAPQTLESSILEKSISSTTGQPKPASSTKPSIQVHYFVIKSRLPLLSKRYWENGALQNRTVDMLFAEVSNLVSRPGIERMSFQIKTSQSESGTSFSWPLMPKLRTPNEDL